MQKAVLGVDIGGTLTKIGMVILVVFFIFFLLKLVVKKYITDNERFYMANKIITFTNVTMIVLIIFLHTTVS